MPPAISIAFRNRHCGLPYICTSSKILLDFSSSKLLLAHIGSCAAGDFDCIPKLSSLKRRYALSRFSLFPPFAPCWSVSPRVIRFRTHSLWHPSSFVYSISIPSKNTQEQSSKRYKFVKFQLRKEHSFGILVTVNYGSE